MYSSLLVFLKYLDNYYWISNIVNDDTEELHVF